MFYQILREVIMNSEEMYEMLGGYLNPNGILFSAILATVIQAIVFLVYLSLRGTALYKMNAKLGEKKLWLAFLPCGCFYLLGKLQDDTMPSSSRNSAYTWTAVIASSIYAVLGILLEVFGAVPTVKAVLAAAESEGITRSFIVS
ncbi:MAG: hypothetical protein J5836_01005, partial [Clostridia bacterium]|nr:hypothetical protein [Clostridia bacterium]